ncbi:MAG: MFS transporter [Negativicutes bacterium]|jgi:fucose permease|nr:MFS transporter [Negativicutes bacterium]
MIATWTAYLLFIFLGYNSMVPGPLASSIAKTLQVDLSALSYATGALYFGRVISVQLAPRLLLPRPYKKTFFLLWLFAVGALLMSAFSPAYPIFVFGWLCVGMLVGSMIFYANYFIVASYDQQERTAKLNLLNFSFAIGAVGGPYLVGDLLERGFPWQVPYLVGVLLLIPCLIGLKVDPELLKPKQELPKNQAEFEWSPSLKFLALAFICYTIGEAGFFFWIVPYMQIDVGFSAQWAAMALSIFWVFMGLGRFFSGQISRWIPTKYFLYSLFCIAIIGYIGTVFLSKGNWSYFWVAVTGLGCSGIYATMLSQATLMNDKPSPKLVSAFVNFGTLGAVSSMILYGFLKNYLTISMLLLSATIFMVMSLGALWMAYRLKK